MYMQQRHKVKDKEREDIYEENQREIKTMLKSIAKKIDIKKRIHHFKVF